MTRVAGTVHTCDGKNINACVIISSSSFFTYQYTTDNSFNLPVVPNSQLVLTVLYMNLNHHQIINSLSPPSSLNVGTVKLCDSISVAANSFTINGGPFHNQLFNIFPTTATGTVNYAIQQTNVSVNGNSPPYTILAYGIRFWNADTVGSFSNVEFEIDINYGLMCQITNVGNDNFVITQIDSIGGRIKGYWSTDCNLETDSCMCTGIASGFFDVVRTQ